MSLPPLKLLVRGPDGLSLLAVPPSGEDLESVIDRVSCKAAVFSADGSKLAYATDDEAKILDTETLKEIVCLSVPGIRALAFSPQGSYLQTSQDPAVQPKNVTVWSLSTKAAVLQQSQKFMSASTWPSIQFSEDETVACRLVTNEVHVFDGSDFSKGVVDRLRLTGITGYQLSFSPASHIAAYVPEIKGAPACVKVYSRAQLGQETPVGRRSFFKSNSAKILWNRGSTAVLIVAQTDVDKSNQSYYGESRLHFISSNGSYEGTVPLKEGPIHGVQWSPSGKEFVVVYGYMPARSTLFDARCKPIFEFGTGPYNSVQWSPHHELICLAGFGNLPGDLAFWDRRSLKALGKTKSSYSVTSEWSADGQYFMTATTAPRMQLDNRIQILRPNGSLFLEKAYQKLFQADWQPSTSVPERPLLLPETETPVVAKQSVETKPPSSAKASAYRPPHAASADALKSQLFGEETKAKGSESKSALKNKKRREKQKEMKGASG